MFESGPLFVHWRGATEQSAWFTIFDGSRLRTSDVDGLLGRVVDGQRDVETVLPGIRLR